LKCNISGPLHHSGK